MTPAELRSELTRLGLSQVAAAKLLDVNAKTVQRWASGEIGIPRSVALLLPMMRPESGLDKLSVGPVRSAPGSRLKPR